MAKAKKKPVLEKSKPPTVPGPVPDREPTKPLPPDDNTWAKKPADKSYGREFDNE